MLIDWMIRDGDRSAAFDAKTHFAQLLQRVERGEEIAISRRGEGRCVAS